MLVGSRDLWLRPAIARITRLCGWAVGLSCGLVVLNQVLAGRLTKYLTVEDGAVEMLSAMIYFFATIVAIAGWVKAPRDAAAPVSLILMAIALTGFVDEVSFGQRIFGWEAPLLRGIYIDAIHDFLEVGYSLVREYLTAAQTASVAAVLLLACCGLAFVSRHQIAASLRYSAATPFIVVAVGFFALALVMDLELIDPERQFALMLSLEETFELSAGWCILAGGLVRWVETAPGG